MIHEDSPNSYRVVQTLTTVTGSRNMGLDTLSHAIFLSAAKFEAPAAGASPRQRPKMVPGTYVVLEVQRR